MASYCAARGAACSRSSTGLTSSAQLPRHSTLPNLDWEIGYVDRESTRNIDAVAR
jgi:hypothetical protein